MLCARRETRAEASWRVLSVGIAIRAKRREGKIEGSDGDAAATQRANAQGPGRLADALKSRARAPACMYILILRMPDETPSLSFVFRACSGASGHRGPQ